MVEANSKCKPKHISHRDSMVKRHSNVTCIEETIFHWLRVPCILQNDNDP